MVELDGDPELVEIFLEEAAELLESIEDTLQKCSDNLSEGGVVADLQRTLHTLKGGARLSGAIPIGDLSHGFESYLTEVERGTIENDMGDLHFAHRLTDRLSEQVDDLLKGPSLRGAEDLLGELDRRIRGESIESDPIVANGVAIESAGTEASSLPEFAEIESDKAEPVSSQTVAANDQPEEEEPAGTDTIPRVEEKTSSVTVSTEEAKTFQPPSRPQREQVRVRSDLLDRLVNNAGEVSIYRSRLEQQNGQLGFNLQELVQTIDRLRQQLRQMDIETETQILFRYEQDAEDDEVVDEAFDPLELDRFSTIQQVSRSLLETVSDLGNIHDFLDELQRETDTLLLQQSRVASDLQDGLLRTRMVPFNQIVPRLSRVVRQTANQLQKQAELKVVGAQGELDRGILERMIGPLEHILRNAVSHGIEPPELRRQNGKPEAGGIELKLERDGTDILITLTDDGAGVNIDDIRKQAIKVGLLDAKADVPDGDILPFVLEHGFSTANEVTQISGRGVGLDVVVSEVKQLGGALDINSKPGEGTSFVIRLPLTLAISDALLVELGSEIYAIRHTSIEGVVRISKQELLNCYDGEQSHYHYAGQDYQVRHLGTLLDLSEANLSEQRKWYPLLLVRTGEHRVALQVDGLLGNRQVVVKSVGIQVASIRWISGGTILGDGRVALILDVSAMVRADIALTVGAAAPAEVEVATPTLSEDAPVLEYAREAEKVDPGVGRTVMVVDDSITVRKVTGRLLERHGMNVITAKDGVDAVAVLQEQRPDIMLLDIEMPRMDGYELARHMRSSAHLQHIPIIMITSRTGEKHRNLGMDLGVKRYLGKPYQEAELLDNIYAVLQEALQ